jgi:hypothetical protein
MSPCPSRLELSRWEASPEVERPIELTTHLRGCSRCLALFDDIATARSLLLGADPIETSIRAARSILAKVQQHKSRRRWLRLLFPAFLVPAAAALLIFAKPVVNPGRVKGPLIVETYCKRGENVFPAEDGADFFPGDRLRFAYTKEKPGFLLVFGVDDQGKVFPYYQEQALVGMYAEAGRQILLPGAVELDNHKGWERIFAIWSETQLTDDVMRLAVASALTAVNGDVRHITALDLPVDQVSMLLRRP